MAIKKEVAQEFVKHFVADIQKKYGDNASLEDILYHFIERGVAPCNRITAYTIIKEHQHWKHECNGTTNDFVFENEQKYELKERQIKNIIYKHTYTYLIEKHVE